MPGLRGGGGVTPYNGLYGEASPERGTISNGRYTKGVYFLPKVVYKREKGRTSGRGICLIPPFTSFPY